MALFVLSLLVSVNAGLVCLTNGWKVNWEIIGSDINFSLQITQKFIDEFDWIAVGFKPWNHPRAAIVEADVVNIFLGSLPVDSYCECDCAPTPDEHLLSPSDLTNISYDSENLTYHWSRKMVTGDPYDIQFVEGQRYRILFASGLLQGTVQIGHLMKDCGLTIVELSNDTVEGCDSVIELS